VKNPRDMEGFLIRVKSAFDILQDRQFRRMNFPMETPEQRKLREPSLSETQDFIMMKCENYLKEWQAWENKHNKKGGEA